jgi:hypothetical protein
MMHDRRDGDIFNDDGVTARTPDRAWPVAYTPWTEAITGCILV